MNLEPFKMVFTRSLEQEPRGFKVFSKIGSTKKHSNLQASLLREPSPPNSWQGDDYEPCEAEEREILVEGVEKSLFSGHNNPHIYILFLNKFWPRIKSQHEIFDILTF